MQTLPIIIVIVFLAISTYGQNSKAVKFVAVDKSGTPIPHCSVSIKGTQIATAANSCGEFELAIMNDDYTIVFNCNSTHDFVTFEQRVKKDAIPTGATIVFQLRKHGRIQNESCKKVSKRLMRVKVK